MSTHHETGHPRETNVFDANWLSGKLGISMEEAERWLHGDGQLSDTCRGDRETIEKYNALQAQMKAGILIRLSDEEKMRVQRAADRCSMPLETYARISLMEQVMTDLNG